MVIIVIYMVISVVGTHKFMRTKFSVVEGSVTGKLPLVLELGRYARNDVSCLANYVKSAPCGIDERLDLHCLRNRQNAGGPTVGTDINAGVHVCVIRPGYGKLLASFPE